MDDSQDTCDSRKFLGVYRFDLGFHAEQSVDDLFVKKLNLFKLGGKGNTPQKKNGKTKKKHPKALKPPTYTCSFFVFNLKISSLSDFKKKSHENSSGQL